MILRETVKKINIFILLGIVLVVAVFSIAGKKTTENSGLMNTSFVAGENIFYNIGEILADQKSHELDIRFKNLNKKGVFNGTILYCENGEEVFKSAYGYEDFRKKDSLELTAAFQLASVSKMFTAAAIMILHEKGKLKYEDTITQFIPEFPFGKVTIRQLLTHRSGLSRYMSLADKYWDINKPINNEEVIDLFVKHKPSPYFKPDNGFHYCNTNYALLASVVERISGQTFDVFVKENIFDPLEMNDSFVYNLRGKEDINSSIDVGVPGYRYSRRRLVEVGDYYLNGVMGDKGVYSSVEDLYKFNKALDDGSLISFEAQQEGFTRGSAKYYKRKDNYGFGWRIRESADSTAYHFGWWKGFRSFYIRDMKNDRTIIALTNTHNGFSSSILWDIIEDKDRTKDLLKIYHSLD
jgi:CubicO group peptidase (beta-lactamase class C family)